MSCKGKVKVKSVHKLVAETFIENSNNSLVVNHINGIKTDNRVENLEWCTQKHNVNEAWKMGLKKGGEYLYNTRPIYQFNMNMKFIKKYESQTEASKLTGINQGDISKCCLGKRNKAGNYIWKFDDGILNELERLQKQNALNSEKTVHTCLHCGKDTPLYCENCYQELISKNAELQLENAELKQYNSKQWKERCKLSFEVDGSIPKQVIRDKIEKLKENISTAQGEELLIFDSKLDVLKELLGDE